MRSAWTSQYEPGNKFNMLTMKTLMLKQSHRHWICTCDCGKDTVPTREDKIVSGAVKSCGCRKKRTGRNNPLWRGCGELNGENFAFIRTQAKLRGIPFEVSIEYVAEQFERQGGKCALTGLALTLFSRRLRVAGHEQTASLDRIDSSFGYVEGNVWWVHKDVNRMKNLFVPDYFVKMCRLVTAHADRIAGYPLA